MRSWYRIVTVINGISKDCMPITSISLLPRQGQVDQQLPRSEDSYDLVSSYEMFFDGSMQKFLVYYNPMPEENNISVRINDPCEMGK